MRISTPANTGLRAQLVNMKCIPVLDRHVQTASLRGGCAHISQVLLDF